MSARRSMSRMPLLVSASLLGLLMLLIAAPIQASVVVKLDKSDFNIDLDDDDDKGLRLGFPSFHHGYEDDDDEDEGPRFKKWWDEGKLRELLDAKREKNEERRERLAALLEKKLEKLKDKIRHGFEHHKDGRKDDECRDDDDHRPDPDDDKGDWDPKPKPKPPVIPEPSTAILMGLGLAGLGHAGRRVRR